ncbi:hypothetical protein FGG08_000087 [Glutinoglossum americanum]|uniref:Uncharacterized protein n=1 Tax=Glutinoglossum americanum TaxID=1670608 RepID=A0A9P8L450_9PEZI|nr:hypothetical protein FGG08_000087 [Glutinoglossum americanum]
MFATIRARGSLLCTRQYQACVIRAYSGPAANDPIPANDPAPSKVPNAPGSNAVPTSPDGAHDHTLQELPEEIEKRGVMQAPNREGTWSRSQQLRSKAMVGPRFEQTIMEDQANHHHKAHLESLPQTSYPLASEGDAAEVPESQRITDEALGQR